ncbi:hypothetical protein D1007_22477 [Hordeum vulgare]|nr:hypothetical protein D1007_22477 [Hordeum vulgare]
MSRRADPSTWPTDFESHRERAARRGKERIRIVEAYLAEEMTEADAADAAKRAAAQEEAIHACILKKRQLRDTRALVREQNRAAREMTGLTSKEEREVSDNEDSSDDEHIRLEQYYVFDRYFHDNDDKGAGKGKGSRE